MATDSKREEIKQQILRWLSHEKIGKWQLVGRMRKSVAIITFYARLIFLKDMNCDVAIEKDVYCVNVMVNPVIAKDDESIYKLSPKPDKYNFWIQVRVNLALMGVNINPISNVDDLTGLQENKPIYFDGWSHDKFIETMLKVTDAVEVAELYFEIFAQSMRQQGPNQG